MELFDKSKFDKSKFYLGSGTVQPTVSRDTPYFYHHFGRCAYHRDTPVMSDSIRKQAEPIVARLNTGELTVEEAVKLLDKIWY